MDYRIYLYDSLGKIQAADNFVAPDDMEALEMGAVLYRATHDVFCRHEVWRGARHLTGITATRLSRIPTLVEMAEERQMRAVEAEERLASSFACIRRSRALLKEVDQVLDAHNHRAVRDCAEQGLKSVMAI